jgi:hypothetical protein
LRAQNTVLLLKHLHKFFNKKDIPWVQLTWKAFYNWPIPPHHRKKVGSFWWRDIINLYDYFFMLASCSANEGDTLYFWRDTWDLGVLQWKFPQLSSFALNKNISLKAFKTWQIERHFWRPHSIEASEQLEELQIMLNNIKIANDENDKWTYIWNSDEYFCHKGYFQIIGINDASPIFQLMWKYV